ncbi:dihydrofolate reductase [Stieleria sp. TO1_6]|uniref:dihydrofolate reductase n=1 Tax=Stieleria tagensis TaxID=2956795 RepID=UPI00209AC9C6|nr:dihydrofolate reductase [Stieleria tagensis]MCO8122369.1 dihydrofolate reductase [Stieleria tagensis]
MTTTDSVGLTAVVAMTPDGVIGRDGDMPWRLRQDLQRFKKMTMGGVLLMGRKTFESIGRPLPGRRTIVITRNANWNFDGVDVASSPEQAVQMARQGAAYVVGGAEIYKQLLPSCDQILLTRVLADIEGDTHLELDLSDFSVIERFSVPAGPQDDVPTEFVRLVRRGSQ